MEARLDVFQEHLYVGLDLHKRRWISTVRTRDLFLKRMATPADKELFVQSLRRQWPQAKFSVVYEAGCFGYHIADYLRTQDIEPIIVAPHRVPDMPGDRIKTDAIDSNKLAEALAAGTLKSIHQRPAPVLYDRGVLRKRLQLIKRRVQIQLQLKADLLFYGFELRSPGSTRWSKRTVASLRSLMFPNERFRRAYLLALDEYDGIAAQLSELNTMVHELLVAEPYVKTVTLLRTIPGIGPLIALSLVLEVEDFARFRNHGEFASYLGLVPSEHSSGERIRRGHLTGMGHTYLRSLLIQAAWVAVRKDPELRRVFDRLAVGGKQRAIVAVARKLAHRIRTVVIEQRPYQVR